MQLEFRVIQPCTVTKGLSQKGDGDEAAIQPHEQRANTGGHRMVLECTNDALRGFATSETVAIEWNLPFSP